MEIAATAMSFREPKVAKTVFIYRNGVINQNPKRMVVNDRQVRDFSTFLTRVTSGLKAPVAVRNIYTPVGGHRVQTLHDLETGKHYVAGGVEHFKKHKYQQCLQGSPARRGGKLEISITRPPAIETKSRVRDLPEKPFVIHVFRNGDALFRGVRVLLPRRVMSSWEQVLEIVTTRADLYTPAKKLYTLEGVMLHTIGDIRDGEKYVAVEGSRQFRKLPYSAIDPTVHNTRPRLRLQQRTRIMYAPGIVARTNKEPAVQQTIAATSDGDDTDSSIATQQRQAKMKTLMPLKSYHGKTRPFAGRKDKEARNKAVLDAREDSIFGGSPPPATIDSSATELQLRESQQTRDRVMDQAATESNVETKEPTLKPESPSVEALEPSAEEAVPDTPVPQVAKEEETSLQDGAQVTVPEEEETSLQDGAQVTVPEEEVKEEVAPDDEPQVAEKEVPPSPPPVAEEEQVAEEETPPSPPVPEEPHAVEEKTSEPSQPPEEPQTVEEEVVEEHTNTEEGDLIELQTQQQTSIDLSVKRLEEKNEEDKKEEVIGSSNEQTPHDEEQVTADDDGPVASNGQQLHNPSNSSVQSHQSHTSRASQQSRTSGAVSKTSSTSSKKHQFIH